MIVTSHPITVSYFVRDITEALLTFDRMVWFRSRTGDDGLFEAATAVAPVAATISGAAVGPHAVDGKTLSLIIDGTTALDVVFSGGDPYTTAAVVSDINGASADVVASADAEDRLVLTSATTGSLSSLEVVESDAAVYLGFSTGDAAVGLDQNVVLVGGTHQYFYLDQNSDETFSYKIQLLNSSTLQVSNLSVPIPASQIPIIPYSQTTVASIRLVDMSGRPLSGRRVTVFNVFQPNIVQGHGVFRHYLQMTTDVDGYAETRILRGMKVDLSIDGSGFVRRLQIPSNVDVVDLLDPALVVGDEFEIAEPNIDWAIRTS